jgi:hypothetical protein
MEEKEDEPNVFSVTVDNLPPGKSVDILITYVIELEFEEGQLKFSLPSNNDNPSYSVASHSAPYLKLRVDEVAEVVAEEDEDEDEGLSRTTRTTPCHRPPRARARKRARGSRSAARARLLLTLL